MLLLNILEMYDSYRIQVKAGRAQGNNTGQRRMGIYFSLKIHRIAEQENLSRALGKKKNHKVVKLTNH